MNRSERVIKLLEDHIDPEEPYPTNSEKDFEHTKSTHNKLTKEASKHLKWNEENTPKAKAVKSYSSTSYSGINNHLRHGSNITADRKSHIEPLKELTRNTTEHHFTVYRGSKEKLFDHNEGSTFKDKGFTSTSLRPSIAKAFSKMDKNNKDKSDPSEHHQYRIHVTPGTKGHYLSGHLTSGEREREYLLHPGTTFKVGKQHKHADGHVYTDLHIHHQED